MTRHELEQVLRCYRAEVVDGSVVTPRYRMKYQSWGSGPPLIVIHGLNDVPQSFAPLMMQLKSTYRCIAIQLPDGCGDGAHLPSYMHNYYAVDMIALLDHLNLDRVTLFGSSFGSTIALRLAAEHPERIERVILQGGFARRPLNAAEKGLAHLGRSWPWRMGDLPIRPRIMRHLEAPAFAHAPQMLEFLLENSSHTPIRAATHRARILMSLDLRPVLPTIRRPLLMIGGDRDAIVPRACEAEVERGVPGVRRIEFPICGHYPQYTHSQDLAEAVLAFGRERF